MNEDSFGAKTRILDDKEQGPQEIELIRDVWETLVNAALQQAGYGDIRVDKRTLEDQGIDRIPQIHIGPQAKAADAAEGKKEAKGDQGDSEGGDESGEDGKTGKSGNGDSGGLAPQAAKTPEDEEAKESPLDQNRRRADFVEEIKKINAQRAAFSDIPLDTQIEAIESLMDRLDTRVRHFGTLLNRTSLPHALIKSIKSIIQFSKDLLISRIQSRETYQTLKEERQARSERQSLRYGRTYRLGIHERMQEMKSQIQRLEDTTQSYKQYKGFVDQIDKEIAKRPAIALSAAAELPLPATVFTPKETPKTLTLKAEVLRQNIPIEYRTSPDNKAAPLKNEFSLKAAIQVAEKLPLKTQNPVSSPDIMADRKSWFIPASEKTRPMQEMIDKRLAEIRESNPRKDERAAQTATLRGRFNSYAENDPAIRKTTNEIVREKIRTETTERRKNIPPEYRAEPYSEAEQVHPDIKNSSALNQSDQPPQAEKPRTKMSDRFNKAAASPVSKGENPAPGADPAYQP